MTFVTTFQGNFHTEFSQNTHFFHEYFFGNYHVIKRIDSLAQGYKTCNEFHKHPM